MSTFGGFIKEIDGICIDNFQSHTNTATTFFLSHVHSDHMKGIHFKRSDCVPPTEEDMAFLNRLKDEEDVYVYSSEATTKMLQLWFSDYEDKFRSLSLGATSIVDIARRDSKIAVTLLPAGHCPGAVMFLFEGSKRILYTGDFRMDVRYFKNCSMLYDGFGELKKFDKLLLDTTFFDEEHEEFPTRKQSEEALCKIIGHWIDSHPDNVVNIKTSAVYGVEFLLQDISKHFNKPIHVSQRVFDVLKYFPDFDTVITRDVKTPIVAYYFAQDKILSPHAIDILVSCYSWTNWKIGDPVAQECFSGGFRFKVCNAMHSSYRELRDFIDFIKADVVEANVVPTNEHDKNKMNALLKKCVDAYKIKRSEVVDTIGGEVVFENFNDEDISSKSDIDSDYGDLLDSPPRIEYKKPKLDISAHSI